VEHRQLRRHVGLWCGVLGGSLALILTIHFVHMHRTLRRERPKQTLKDLSREFGLKVSRMQEIQGELHRLSFAREIKRRQAYSGVLHKLSELMAPQVWLTECVLQSGGEGQPGVLALSGFSLSNSELGTMIKSLASDPSFDDVVLGFSKETQRARLWAGQETPLKVIEFKIECRIPGG
jgi:Tfp pilus assembly protein PilN